jgi:hypothetical protein
MHARMNIYRRVPVNKCRRNKANRQSPLGYRNEHRRQDAPTEY